MAKKSDKKPEAEEEILDAEVVEETTSQTAEKPDDTAPEPDVVDDEVADAETEETEEIALLEPENEQAPEAEAIDETPPVTNQQPEPVRPTSAQPSGTSSFIPLLLGGLVAGLIGYGIANYGQPAQDDSLRADIDALQRQTGDLNAELSNLPTVPDLSPLEAQLGDLSTQLTDLSGAVEADLAALEARLEEVEKQPSSDGTLQEAAIAAFERDLEELRGEIAGQRDELQRVVDAAASQLDETRAQAEALEVDARASAQRAIAQSALARIQSALESGTDFNSELSELASALAQPAPDALANVSDGAPTLSELQSSFPAVAREALAVARSEGASGEETSGLTAFLRNQFDVRSVTPREGDSADAILSRAEAALQEGRLNDAMAEVAALPEVVRAVLSDWQALAEARAAALDASAAVASELNAN